MGVIISSITIPEIAGSYRLTMTLVGIVFLFLFFGGGWFISRSVTSLYLRNKGKVSERVRRRVHSKVGAPVSDVFRLLLIIVFGHLFLVSSKEYLVEGYLDEPGFMGMTPYFSFLFLAATVGITVHFILEPAIAMVMGSVWKRQLKKRTAAVKASYMVMPIRIGYWLFLAYLILFVYYPFEQDLSHSGTIEFLFLFSGLMIVTLFIMRFVVVILQQTTFHRNRVDKNSSASLEKLAKYLIFILGIGISMVILGVDLYAVATGLGLVAFALAFGLQDSVANFAAGIQLALDRPFDIGDRVRVGDQARETWGDVVDISLRSTSIKTTEEELVNIPNHIIANSEIWNYTRDSTRLVELIDIGISYGSQWRHAEKIILEVANDHPHVLKNPKPFVRLHEFSDSAQVLRLWVYIPEARDRFQIRSDLLKEIKDRFDEEGVEIPFSYHTIVFKKDLPDERKFDEAEKDQYHDLRRYPSRGTDYYEWGGKKGDDGQHYAGGAMIMGDETRILAPVSSSKSAAMLAEFTMKMATNIGGHIIAIHVVEKRRGNTQLDGIHALDIFERVGRAHNINVATLLLDGDPKTVILDTVDNKDIDIVVMGRSKKAFKGILGEDLSSEISREVHVPVVLMPYRSELMRHRHG